MQKWEYIVQQFQSPNQLFTLLNLLGGGRGGRSLLRDRR
jgi:hypothetical protein